MIDPNDAEFLARRAIAFGKYRKSKAEMARRKTTAGQRIDWLDEMHELLREFLPPRDGSDPRVTYDAWGAPISGIYPSPDD